jgi:hypothetical protein
MGFGKRSSTLNKNNNFEMPITTKLLKSNWIVRPFIYGMHPIPRELF